jgi:hypothetical protein
VKVLAMTGLAMLIAVVMFDILSVPTESGLVSYTYAPAPYDNVGPATGSRIPSGPVGVSAPVPVGLGTR